MKQFYRHSVAGVLAVAMTLGLSGMALAAPTQVDLGTAANFVVLAGSTVTNTGASVLSADLGLHPGTSVTGFPPGIVNGTQHVTDATALQAQSDLTTAYLDTAGRTPVTTVPTELGGTTKTAGVYDSAAGTFGITGTLTLDAQGDANSVFIFKTASTLITAGASSISLVNGAQACNVFWQVGSSATLGTDSIFKGNIMALTSITATTGANIEGRLLARNAAVTLDTNTITKAICAAGTTGGSATTTSTTTTNTDSSTASSTSGSSTSTSTTKLPSTGLPPLENRSPISTALPIGVAVLTLTTLAIVARKRTI
jgi:hypothetical protein